MSLSVIPSLHSFQLGNYRSLLLDSGGARIPVTLTRQNAIRRIGGTDRGYVGPTSQLFDRLFDLHARDRSGPLMNVNGRIVNVSSNLLDSPEERRMRQPASAPSALDRFTDGADMMDGVSMQYVAIIINTIVTRVARKRVEEEKAKEAAEEAAKKASEESSKPTSSENAPSTSEDADNSNATATVLAHPPTEVAHGEASGLPVVDGEAMDTSEAFEPRDAEADVSMDEAPPHSSAATVASSLPEAEADEERMITPPLSTAQNASRDGEERDASDRSDNSGHTETTTDEPLPDGAAGSAVPPESNNAIPEEFRDILGDIEIPDGVDPAFLAALPEDMRAEVIRDHRRQQRAQRAAQPPSVPQQEGNGEGGSNTVPAVEPIDQDFLAALPPELQEEILAQHERAVREAEEALRRANAPAPPVPPEPEMDGAAVIASLPAHERTQVLAEMEESELQRLPADMQEEARRARASLEPLQNILRFRHLLMPSSARSRGLRSNVNLSGFGTSYAGVGTSGSGAGTSGTPAVGSLAGQANTANAQSLQLLDRDSILILTMLFLVDNRLSNGRLQKVIRLACSHANTCDFVIWCLLALLEKAHDGAVDEEELVSVCPSWLDSITVSGVGHNERALKIGKHVSKVAIHPLLSLPLSKNVLDTLATIAKTYPGHFLPSSLRKTQTLGKDSGSDGATVRDASPPMDLFWELVQASSCKSLTAKEARESGERMSLETSHMGRLMKHLNKPVVAKTGTIQDRLLRVISTIVQTLPNETMTLLGNLEGPHPLEGQLKAVIDVLMRGSCSNEGLADGRTLLVECMRALPPSITDTIYEQLFSAVENVGLELQPQIERLIEELGEPETPSPVSDEIPSTSKASPPSNVEADGSTMNTTAAGADRDRRLTRTRIGRLVLDAENSGRFTLSASSCPELQLPAVTMLTDKSGAQYKLLSALQTLSKIRDTMRQMKEERRKKEELEKKKKEEESKAAETTTNSTNEHKTIDPVAVDDSSPAAASQTSATGDTPAGPTSPETRTAEQEQSKNVVEEENNEDVVLSHRLTRLDGLWESVSTCLLRLGKASDHHAVLALQPAAEAFFLVHAVPRPANAATDHHDDPDTLKMIAFAEKHREVLNQVLRQNNTALSPGGPFAALIQFPKLLDFDVKRKYFRKELGKMDGDRGHVLMGFSSIAHGLIP
ncbi:sodium pump decarboxylase, gamma subunit [Ancylostoma caninum]|uniref:Sodium pump decarboxylase, gamma subunit n=1 Tax=Ancylostoma caninum TaxID=29170 RepID=A0A368G140_ANCCA|nr:sodium pump decarboxylase, gamma subunit [Ancylostoma caninum]